MKMMFSSKRTDRFLFFTITGIVAVLLSQAIWMLNTYRFTKQQLMAEVKEAFAPAYQKEQTYRIPILNIVNTGAVTIESCGTEKVQIIRNCPEPDTVFYNNLSSYSIESFINHVFVGLREQIIPININCLADLFSGMLFEKDIPVHFVIERFNTSTGEILDSSLLPDKKQPKINPETTVIMDISDKESLRAVIQITPGVIFRRMADKICYAILLTIIINVCIWFLCVKRMKEHKFSPVDNTASLSENTVDPAYAIGQYVFNPAKNELQGFGETIQLNKKENAILNLLCLHCGNVVERSFLLQENWGKSGIIYSRSLDTYITTLRKHLKKEQTVQIITIKGVGYKLVK
jgi:succinate dehydrogenase hydrophobic anchor subunit